MSASTNQAVLDRISGLDWNKVSESLWSCGYALTEPVLSERECLEIAPMFERDDLFRSVTDMGKRGFGRGIYKYFKYPLPAVVKELRESIYEFVAPTANAFNEALKVDERYPAHHTGLIEMCNRLGQTRPTPLMLHYEPGDFNCMHQDIYGKLTFPFQVTIFLSQPGVDYEGGEFLVQEQAPRMQSRIHALKPQRGQMIVFTTRHRPQSGARGFKKMNVKHGVATVERGKRDTLGIIFHDAE